MTTLALHLLLILVEYKPPSLENLKYLIQGGHPTLNRVFSNFVAQAECTNEADSQALKKAVLDDLTLNEHFRLLRVIHGRINMDPMYAGLTQYFSNVVQCQNSYLPNSMAQVPFSQEIFVLMWRLLTTNDVSPSFLSNHPTSGCLQRLHSPARLLPDGPDCHSVHT